MTQDAIGPNVELLEQLLQFLARLSDAQYRHVETRLTSASIGAHVRHEVAPLLRDTRGERA